MMTLDDLRLLVKIAELGSLTAAAHQTGRLPATVSATLKRLERDLDTRLFDRTTRAIRLTDAGRGYITRLRTALDLLDDAAGQLRDDRDGLSGPLRISAPSDLGRTLVAPWLDLFQERHPGITVTLLLGDRLADLLRDDVDMALRYGRLADSGLTRKILCANHRVIVASPAYLDRHGRPATPADLAEHSTLALMRDGEAVSDWPLTRITAAGTMAGGGPADSLTVTTRPARVSDDGAVVRQWALDGRGLACKSHLDVAADLRAGRLEQVLPDWRGDDTPLQLLTLDRRHRPRRMQALADFLAAQVAAHLRAVA